MKYFRIFLIILVGFLMMPLVSAKEKTVSFIEYKEAIHYDERSIKEDDFTKEMDLVGDKRYEETFVIRNDSKKKIETFLLLESTSADGSYNDIMDYATLKVSLDDTVLYDGSASVMNYALEREKLYDLVSLGKLEKKSQQNLKIELTLLDSYQSVSNNKFAYITVSFYTKDQNKNYTLIEKATPQMIYNFLDVWVFCGVCVFVGLLILSILYVKKHPIKKKEKKDEEEENKEEKESKKK